jgi:hypothetical protein
MNSLYFLIKQIELIDYKYKKINEISLDNFNIFSILRDDRDEVHLHSKFLYEILNPKGSHNQQDIFLKLFLEDIISIDDMEIFTLYRERYNIDILMVSHKRVIILENKIDTTDHSNQLSRYIKSMRDKGYKDISTIYLTLNGEKPNEDIEDIICLSYSKDIKEWLGKSIEKVAQKPTLRETLIQYLNLINKITYQTDNRGFIMEVKELLLERDNLKTILSIEESIIEAKIETQLIFWNSLLNKLQARYDFYFYSIYGDNSINSSVRKYYTKKKNRKDYGFEYKIDENLSFFIEIRDNIYYGFYFRDDSKIEKRQLDALNSIDINWQESYWKYPDKRLNFEHFNNENILDLLEKAKRKIDIDKIFNEILFLIENYQKGLIDVK